MAGELIQFPALAASAGGAGDEVAPTLPAAPPAPAAGTVLARGDAIEGELLTEEENRALDHRLATPGGLAARVVRVVRESERSARAGKAVVRHALTVYLGVESWTKRAWDAGTMGVYRRQVKSAEAAGNQELLQEWTDRKEAAVKHRHKRLMDLPRFALGIAKAMLGGLATLVILVLVIALLVQLSGEGEFLEVLAGVMGAVAWLFAVVAFVWTPLLIAAPFLLVLGAWREGTRRQHAPRWLLRWSGDLPMGGTVITPEGIVRALQHLSIPKLNEGFKNGWMIRFELLPTREGQGAFKGYRTIFDLPDGVTPGMVADKGDVLAVNLRRNAIEVWPSDYGQEKGGKAGFVNLYVADAGVMDKPTPEYPLMHEGTADVFEGVPIGITQRGDMVPMPLNGSNFVFGGRPGQGKSNAVRVVFAGAALDPLAELRVHVFAGNGDFDAYERRLSRYHKGATPEHAALATAHLEELLAEVERRENRLAELGAKKLTRQIAQQHPDMRPLLVGFSECHELFGDKDCGETAADLSVRVAKRGRKTGVMLGFDTQSSRANAIPSQLVENMGVNGCFSVKTWRNNDGFLGDGSFAAGIRATELRFNVDRGTMLATGISDELFEIVRTYFIEVDDDEGWDAATEIIDRAMTAVAAGVPTGATSPAPRQIEETRDLLDDLDEVLDTEPVKVADVPALLRELAPHWMRYRSLTGTDLRAWLERDYRIKVPSTNNRYPVDPVAIREALARRATADLDEERTSR